VLNVGIDMTKDKLFWNEVKDVKPLSQNTAEIGKKSNNSASIALRRDAAVVESIADNYLATSYVKEIGPFDIVSFKRGGIQEGVFRKLRLGKYASDARIDLHRMTVEEARKSVYEFINDCVGYELRTLLIVHGKGDKKPDKKSILKMYVAHWLEEIPDVMAFHSALPEHGGTGALYVLLRKSETAKQRNREKYGQKT
jgi:DNA-nicking Smr family endonuclease